jgi:hypothetical protein
MQPLPWLCSRMAGLIAAGEVTMATTSISPCALQPGRQPGYHLRRRWQAHHRLLPAVMSLPCPVYSRMAVAAAGYAHTGPYTDFALARYESEGGFTYNPNGQLRILSAGGGWPIPSPTVSDGFYTDTATVSITILGVDDPLAFTPIPTFPHFQTPTMGEGATLPQIPGVGILGRAGRGSLPPPPFIPVYCWLPVPPRQRPD